MTAPSGRSLLAILLSSLGAALLVKLLKLDGGDR